MTKKRNICYIFAVKGEKMNEIKKALIIAAIVLNIINVGLNIYFVVTYFMLPEIEREPLFYTIFEILQAVAFLVSAIFLIYSIADNGKSFQKRYGFYMTSVMIGLILNLFSASTIILIISMFISDIKWIKEIGDPTLVETKSDKERKIEELRRLKEEGKITEKEFEDELLKLL